MIDRLACRIKISEVLSDHGMAVIRYRRKMEQHWQDQSRADSEGVLKPLQSAPDLPAIQLTIVPFSALRPNPRRQWQ